MVRDGRVVGEGYHRRAGEAHAEPQALEQAGSNARGSTVYVSLEPCRHVGRTPPCTKALIEAGVARVVAGTLDPTDHGGANQLKKRGIEFVVAEDQAARALIEIFAGTMRSNRPYAALKMAMSLDGVIAPRPGLQARIGSEAEERYVRELRTISDAVMVGAGTIRVDDPRLTVRPPHDRVRPYVRIVACESDAVSVRSRVFAAEDGYSKTVVLAPAGLRTMFDGLREVADVIDVGSAGAVTLDLRQAMESLRARGIFSVLCEGGPKLGASLLGARLIDRVYWAIAPRFLSGAAAVPVLSGTDLDIGLARFDRVERVGPDVVVSGTPCSAA